ncbi:MAG TPA: hypothetical protein ENK24_03240 [Anaerolineae bacterium]|nr:hypothetical protein [Anaerolineae bacterium]
MCGIATTLLKPQQRSPQVWSAIKDTFTRNLLCNEERGRAATGLAVVQSNGQVSVQKMAIPASEFVTRPEYHALLEQVGAQTTLLMGHTRRPTQGAPSNDANNHPVQAGPVFGVHNGHIDNDDSLFARFGLPRQAQVDSEIIFRLLEPLTPTQMNGDYFDAVCPRLQLLQGKFTFLAVDQRAPDKLLVLKHNNPLSLHFEADWNALIFSSRYIFLRKAFGRNVITEALPHDKLLLFEAGNLSQYRSQPAVDCALF